MISMGTGVVLAHKSGNCNQIYDNIPATNPTQHTTSRQDEAITTTNHHQHHHMNVFKDDGMDLQEIDW
jgi:hypothetical protein